MDHVAFIMKAADGRVYNLPIDKEWGINSEIEMHEVLFGLVRYWKPDLVFESGCALGFSTEALGRACLANMGGSVVSCDTNLLCVEQARRRVSQLPCRVEHKSSLDLPELKAADFVFSDSSYEARMQEYEVVKAGALFVVHDANQEHAIGDFVRSNGGFIVPRGRGFGIIVKKENYGEAER